MGLRNNQASGNVYLLKRDDGLIKIGRTTFDVAHRQKMLKRQSRWSTTLVWSLACTDQVSTERALHALFRHCHVGREWFQLSVSDVIWITAQTETGLIAAASGLNQKRIDGGC